jgi:hypothetical protein
MRFEPKIKERKMAIGDTRVVLRRLWLPLRLPLPNSVCLQVRWLESAAIRQRVCQRWHFNGRRGISYLAWVNLEWAD